MSELLLHIDGMSCDHCVRHVTKALEKTPGVVVKKVDVGSATVDYDGTPASVDAMVAAIDRAGYTAKPKAAGAAADERH
jgi:copper chaperone CopZ